MRKPVVLIVDDEASARTMVIDFLKKRYECEFSEAKDGEVAINFLKCNPCDIMILDIKMPRKSGITVIKEAKEIDPKIDVLVISAWLSDDVSNEAVEIGATDYLVKPIDLKVVAMKLADILQRKGYTINKT